MKTNLIAALLLTISFLSVNAQDEEYIKAMELNLEKFDSAKTSVELMQVTNVFERISLKESQQWLPLYHASYCYIILNYMEKSKKQKDLYIDKAEELLNKAQEICIDEENVELILLKAYILQSRSNVNPGSRARKIQPLADKLLKKANTIDPENPRYYFLIGQNLFYTPKMFGGGKDKAKPILEKAMEKYQSFKPESTIHPMWDMDQSKMLLQQCN